MPDYKKGKVFVEAFNDGGTMIDIRVVGLENFYVKDYDFEKFDIAVGDYNIKDLPKCEWITFTLVPQYESHIDQPTRLDWYEIKEWKLSEE